MTDAIPSPADLAAVKRLGIHECRGGTSADYCEYCGSPIERMLWPEQVQVMTQLLATLQQLNVNLISTATAKENLKL